MRATLVRDGQTILPEPDDEPKPDDEPEPGTLCFGEDFTREGWTGCTTDGW